MGMRREGGVVQSSPLNPLWMVMCLFTYRPRVRSVIPLSPCVPVTAYLLPPPHPQTRSGVISVEAACEAKMWWLWTWAARHGPGAQSVPIHHNAEEKQNEHRHIYCDSCIYLAEIWFYSVRYCCLLGCFFKRWRFAISKVQHAVLLILLRPPVSSEV